MSGPARREVEAPPRLVHEDEEALRGHACGPRIRGLRLPHTSRQESQEQTLSKQQAEIRSLQVALQGIVTQYEFDKLVGLSTDAPFPCYYSDDLYAELKRLRAMSLVHHHDGVGLSIIRKEYKDSNQQFDLKRFF